MVELFGVDIAQVVADSITEAGNLRPGILTKIVPGTRTGGSLTGGTNPTETSHTFQGFVETKTSRREGTLVADPMSVVTILGATVTPFTEPEVNDGAIIDNVTWNLGKLLSRDPASAVYEFEAST